MGGIGSRKKLDRKRLQKIVPSSRFVIRGKMASEFKILSTTATKRVASRCKGGSSYSAVAV